ncbi:MAG: phenylacetate-CoA oxygenase subunit PaaC [Bacteroidota bacterium]|nr:phenylacetate-CoA oxygenase subunit PaaC [Bacteroidota bacterium]
MDLVSDYIIHQADNALILGHHNSEWTGHGPILEQDIALSNISLDLIGQARNFYQLAALRINELTPEENITEDDLAYLRDANEFRNFVLVEQLNGDWALTILRQFYFSNYQFLLYKELLKSDYPEIAAISEKSIKETSYHLKWSTEWVLRLGDGTEESHLRMSNAQMALNPWISELFLPVDFEYEADACGAGILPDVLKEEWYHRVNRIMETATLPGVSSEKKGMQLLSGKKGVHSEHLGYLLAEMQFLQRAYPGNTW